MARSSKPRRPYRNKSRFHLVLTRGGGAELLEPSTEHLIWSSDDDDQFLERFEHFLNQSDLEDILDYLVEIGELTEGEADQCECSEDYFGPSDITGVFGQEL